MKSWNGVAAAVALAVALAGCADMAGDAPPATTAAAPPTSSEATARFDASTPEELRARDPKDARGIPVCELLTRDQLLQLGLDPATARPNSFLRGDGCSWRLADDSTRAAVGLTIDPQAYKLPDFYRIRDSFQVFEILEVAGHPAVRADGEPTGECTLNVAISDVQILTTEGYLDGRVLPDPCAPARRMAELVLSNLPPLQ
jgi:hypothetical protein